MLGIRKSLVIFGIVYLCFVFSDDYNRPESFNEGWNRITAEYRQWTGHSQCCLYRTHWATCLWIGGHMWLLPWGISFSMNTTIRYSFPDDLRYRYMSFDTYAKAIKCIKILERVQVKAEVKIWLTFMRCSPLMNWKPSLTFSRRQWEEMKFYLKYGNRSSR